MAADHTLAPISTYFKPLDHPVDEDLVEAVDYGPNEPRYDEKR